MDVADWSGLFNSIGSQITSVYKAVNTPSVIPIGATGTVAIGGQTYMPSTLTSTSNMGTLLLFGAIGVLVVVLLRR